MTKTAHLLQALAAIALLGALASPSLAAPEPAETPVHRGDGDVPFVRGIWLEHSGSFRFRPELLLGGDLGNGQGGVPAPIAASSGVDSDASTLGWASIRLLYAPTLHLGRNLSIHVGVDAFSNMLLGSTHANAGGDVALDVLNDSQAPPSAGQNAWKDALRVRHAFGRLVAFDMLTLDFGRFPQHFGLGMSRNDGSCEDCDFLTVNDGIRLGFTISDFRIEGSWELSAFGATTARPGELGQPKDLGLADDSDTYTIAFGQRPTTAAELEARRVLLDETRGWAVDWSILNTLTDQQLSSAAQKAETSLECRPEAVTAQGQPLTDVDCVQLYERDAFLWRPGLWVRAEWRPEYAKRLSIELEFQGLIGDIAHPQRLDEEDSQEAKDLAGFGAALEVAYGTGALGLGLDFGFATGDDGDFIGVLDGQNIVDPDDDAYAQNANVRNNRTVSNFVFHRDYRVDLILFRQILGSVTNAVYLKPWVSYDILQMEGALLSARLDLLYAAAAVPEGTPGGGSHWGLELDAQVGLVLDSGLSLNLAGGVLFPFDALDNAVTGVGGEPVLAFRALLGWGF